MDSAFIHRSTIVTLQLSLFDPTGDVVLSPVSVASAPADATVTAPSDPPVHRAAFSLNVAAKPAKAIAAEADAKLFGALWPLGDIVKLDATVDRSVLRQQCNRLNILGYKFAPLSQDWHLASV